MMDILKYPIGQFEARPYSALQKKEWILQVQTLPARVEYQIQNLDEHQLQTPYRPGGWTVHQLVHHIADSHANAFIRFKLGLTEDNPTIKPYDEGAWAKLSDTKNLPVNVSLTLLHALHLRWTELLKHMTDAQWERTIYHPGDDKKIVLWDLLGMYAWHGNHHLAHLKGAEHYF